MRRSLAVTGIITAGLTALALTATPALAQGGPRNIANASGTGICSITGTAPTTPGANATGTAGQGYGRGNGTGNGMGNGMGGGMRGTGANLAPMGTLTSSQKADLVSMTEEEKLAHDVYVTLAATFPTDYQFARIANAETMHQTALRTLLTRYAITDPTDGLAVGEFTTSAFQTLYDSLVDQATTATNALDAGIAVEKRDIADLTTALTGLTAPDVTQVYTNLRNASQHHLTAFGG
jgi:hypothetical protein